MDRSGGIGLDDDHVVLRDTARRWLQANCPPTSARTALEAETETMPEWWPDLAGLGWLGLHVDEADGGSGYGLLELCVVLEELGRACAPGPLLPTVIAAAVIDSHAASGHGARSLLPGLASGERVAGVGLGSEAVAARLVGDELVVDGAWPVVFGGTSADVVLVPTLAEDGVERWVATPVDVLSVEPLEGVDRTRRPARITATGLRVRLDEAIEIDTPTVSALAGLLLAAESVGAAAWCVETAAVHAADREQFGRPIGQFQGIKHRCADMLCTLEAARAATWDAARAVDRRDPGADLAVAVAVALGPAAAYECAKDCIQVLGGIGFTWEHDAHLYLKRAMADRATIGTPSRWHRRVAALAERGVRHDVAIDLPPEAEPIRDGVGAFLDDLLTHDKPEWNRMLADAGYIVPHWPAPWGRDASPLEQLVIDQELRAAKVRRPHLAVALWALPTIMVHGTAEQQERFMLPSLRQEIVWCQMFSEPGAGSDLASLTTRATRTDGGWLLTGQKVWTSLAHFAHWGICLARTDPDAPKHDGIGCFLVDMQSEGLDIRPLRELTGAEMFNEVFLDEVFVPDECVVGSPTGGWQAARTTLGNERVSMGSGSSMGPGLEKLVELASETAAFDDAAAAETIGELVATAQALAALGTRMTLRALMGAEPGADASVRKLVGVEHDQRVQEVGLELLGPAAASGTGPSRRWVGGFLGNRALSIAGGTSEIQRNVIAERLLGLPRDP